MQEIIIFAEQMLLDPHSRPTSGIDVLLALLACWQCCSVGTNGLLALLACWYCWPVGTVGLLAYQGLQSSSVAPHYAVVFRDESIVGNDNHLSVGNLINALRE